MAKVTLSGSLRRHHVELLKSRRAMAKAGAAVLSPAEGRPVDEVSGFVLLEGESGGPHHIEQKHLAAIAASDLLYVVAPDGIIGTSTSLEIGVAWALGVPVFADAVPQEIVFHPMLTVASPEEALNHARQRRASTLGTDLDRLQNAAENQAARLGFQNEKTRDLVLMAVEEFGELAALVRQGAPLSTHQPKDGDIGEELADILIYLLSIANAEGLSLGDALRRKMLVNEGRTWTMEEAR